MTKTDIVQAAFRIWGRDFYQTTSLTKLAQELRVSKPALYRHFHNKQDLLDTMYRGFFDEYAAFIRDSYERAVAAADKTEGYFIMMRAVAEYYGRNVGAFIFSLARVFGNLDQNNLLTELAARGIDMKKFFPAETDPSLYPSKIQAMILTVTFWVGHFHKYGHNIDEAPTDGQIREIIASLEGKLAQGLGFTQEQAASIDYDALEKQVCGEACTSAENDELLRAIAGAVAEVGPWNASMNMVARRSGLSKSGLYAHFTSKRDMLNRFFLTEFDRIVAYVEANTWKSAVPEEQLYLLIISFVNYFRVYPELLAAIDWLRIRRIDLGLLPPPQVYALFSSVKLDAFKADQDSFESSSERTPQWILFLIVNALMRHPSGTACSEVPNTCVRTLYRFITLGLKGFEL